MGQIHVVARITVNEGKLDELLAAGEKALGIVRDKDPGTLRYDWFVSDDKKTVTVLESYESNEAVGAHMANMSEVLGALGALGAMELQVYGDVAEQLKAAAAGMGAKFHAPKFAL